MKESIHDKYLSLLDGNHVDMSRAELIQMFFDIVCDFIESGYILKLYIDRESHNLFIGLCEELERNDVGFSYDSGYKMLSSTSSNGTVFIIVQDILQIEINIITYVRGLQELDLMVMFDGRFWVDSSDNTVVRL